MNRINEGGKDALSNRFKKKLKKSVDDANHVIQLLFLFSNNYNQISGKYMMPMVASYGRMISMTKEEDIKKLQEEINQKARGMQEVIEAMIKANHARYKVEYQEPKEAQSKRKSNCDDSINSAKKQRKT